MATPRVEIDLKKLAHNSKVLSDLYGSKNISICAVTKVICSDLIIAETLLSTGITMIADSKITNLRKLQEHGIKATFLLIGTPKLSQVNEIIKWADISNNSELVVIKELGRQACLEGLIHQIILMVEMGDLREGFMPESLDEVISEIILLDGIEVVGLGTNLACLNGVRPDKEKMDLLSTLVKNIEQKFQLSFQFVSGGNSANYEWFNAVNDVGRINHLRIGESIFLGVDPVNRRPILNLFTDIFTLVTEVTELKIKPSIPFGELGLSTFGHIQERQEKGEMYRAILGVGQQDVDVSGLTPNINIEILGSGSDHVIIDPKKNQLHVGDELTFSLNYSALMSAMTSPYIEKTTIPSYEYERIL